LNSDSAFYRNEYLASMNDLVERLGEDYDVRLFTFGDEVFPLTTKYFDTLGFDKCETDISSVFEMMDVRFVNRNLGALIIATDGIFNKGFNPIYHAANVSCPIYTLALGDTSVRRDAFIKRVMYNRIAFQGNDFPVEMILNASKMPGATISMNIYEGGINIESRQLMVEGNNFSKTLRLNLAAKEPGTHHYVLRIKSNKDEVTLENNRYDLFVEVLESKQKILILANSPHPDISALKEALTSNINYEVEDMLVDEFNGPLQSYSMVILHQLPSSSPASPGLISRLSRAEVPLLFILGEQTNFNVFNGLQTGLQLHPYGSAGMNEAQAALNTSFSTFNISDDIADLVPFLPPLNTPFARYSVANSSRILFYQKIGGIGSTDPLWSLQSGRKTKTGVIAGTGIWKWRMKCWLVSGDHQAFNDIINKSIQFLAVNEDKRHFRVNGNQRFPENAPVILEAELYNESFEPFNEPDVNLKIIDAGGDSYDYVFSRTEDAYILQTGGLDVGTYSFKAVTRVGDMVYTDHGGFVVTPVVTEKISLRAAHGLLGELAEKKDGRMLTVAQMDSLPNMLKERGDVKPLIHAEKKYIEFIDIWWVLVVILALLGVEWFLRKWSGSY
ncbi:MAG: hypothetical protein KAT76_07575, partial [Bacteroidales bacterium]|nr:hypothetical protein [Bacteroidales bacterium]